MSGVGRAVGAGLGLGRAGLGGGGGLGCLLSPPLELPFFLVAEVCGACSRDRRCVT